MLCDALNPNKDSVVLYSWRNDTQHNDIQHIDPRYNDTKHNWLICDTQHK